MAQSFNLKFNEHTEEKKLQAKYNKLKLSYNLIKSKEKETGNILFEYPADWDVLVTFFSKLQGLWDAEFGSFHDDFPEIDLVG